VTYASIFYVLIKSFRYVTMQRYPLTLTACAKQALMSG